MAAFSELSMGATPVDFYGDKDSNFLTVRLNTAAVSCRGGADSVKLSYSCRFTDGDLRVAYGDCRIHFFTELIILNFCGC